MGVNANTKNIQAAQHTEFDGKSNMMTWSTSRSRPLAARSVHTNVGQSPSSLRNLFRFSTLHLIINLINMKEFVYHITHKKIEQSKKKTTTNLSSAGTSP